MSYYHCIISASVCFKYVDALVLSAYMYLKLSYLPIQLNLLAICFFVTTFDLKVHFVWYKYSHSYSLVVNICMEFPPIFFTLSLCMSLNLKWISCTQYIVGSYFLCIQFLCIFWLVNLTHLHLDWLLISKIYHYHLAHCFLCCSSFVTLFLSSFVIFWS